LLGRDGIGAPRPDLFPQILVHPHLSLDFPAVDIVNIEEIDESQARYAILVTFLGLYGSSSPLPSFHTEDLLAEQADGGSATRDFLDLLNAPLYALFFQCWNKYRLDVSLFEQPNADVEERLFCLLGFEGTPAASARRDYFGLLRYLGLTTTTVRPAEGLRALLSDHFQEPSLEIMQCTLRVAQIPEDQRCFLGRQSCHLGIDAHVGSEIADLMNKFTIHIGPLGGRRFQEFLPDQSAYAQLNKLTDFYLNQPLVWDVMLEIQPEDVKRARLGELPWSKLGWNTWLYTRKPMPLQSKVLV
jgi:type VI secretion system protein ImpH